MSTMAEELERPSIVNLSYRDTLIETPRKDESIDVSNVDDGTRGYILSPLKERSFFSRLDVGPFLIMYTALIALDCAHDLLYTDQAQQQKNDVQQERQQRQLEGFVIWIVAHPRLHSMTQQRVFPLLLLSHVVLFLLQQWNVLWKATVGYQTCSTSTTDDPTSSSSSAFSHSDDHWTHCLVQAPLVDQHESSYEAGIVPVAFQHLPQSTTAKSNATKEISNKMVRVAVVKYQDIIFRACYNNTGVIDREEDADVMLWSPQNLSSTVNVGKVAEEEDRSNDYMTKSPMVRASQTLKDGKKTNTLTGLFHRLRYPTHLPLSFYLMQWHGHSTMSQVVMAKHVYGTNETPIHLPPFLELVQEQVVAPFFLFQVLCVILWSLDEYWYYAIFTFFALLMFESTVAYNRLQSLQRLRSHSAGCGGDSNTMKLVYVYRPGFPPNTQGWILVAVPELVPGDIVSCKVIQTPAPPKRTNIGDGMRLNSQQMNQQQQLQPFARVPADILVLHGDAVVDESLLTGESIPQLKVPLDETSSSNAAMQATTSTMTPSNKPDHATLDESLLTTLDLQEHKQSVLFGGTNLLVSHGPATSAPPTNRQRLPSPPDDGVVGVVLRTGFETAQGSLLRTLAQTQKSAHGIHTTDTYVFIILLLLCAIASASLVWMDGWNDPTRNKFRLTLHVIIIVTSVVPPELPMELSLAVTNSVADLMKRCQVYCTELFRIPLAGQVEVCCFDKTGTLTSDEVQLKGIRLAKTIITSSNSGADVVKFNSDVVKPEKGGGDGELVPWAVGRIMVACHSLALNSSSAAGAEISHVIGDPLEKAVLKHTGYQLVQNNALRRAAREEGGTDQALQLTDGPTTVLILHRYGFSSRLKRMSVLVREDSAPNVTWVVTKGAPETLKQFLTPESIPTDYNEISMHHMGLGQRVLALAYRKLVGKQHGLPKDVTRENIEKDLTFAGFLLLDCPLKPDSSGIVSELQTSGHKVVMITGDAVLTAVAVARQVGIIQKQHGKLKKDRLSSTSPPVYHLQPVAAKLKHQVGTNTTHSPNILDDFGFVPLQNGQDGESIGKVDGLFLSDLQRIRKMTSKGEVALCVSGDGLLKLALAIIQSRLPKNVANGGVTLTKKDRKHSLLDPDVQLVLREVVPMISVFARHAPRQKEAVVAAFNSCGAYTLMCGDGTNDVGALRRAHVGISIISAPEVESKQRSATEAILRAKAEEKQERKARKKGKTKTGTSSSDRQRRRLEDSLRDLREAQEELDQVELGDASVASPFTSRTVSIKCCKDVIQQGRCTLVTMLQIYKILGINCLVNAMVLSKLFLHGVKQGDRQLTILGVAVAALFFLVTRGKPLPTLAPNRPPSSVLCASALLSIAAQFGIHFGAIMIATEASLSFVDPYDPSMIPDGPFNPNTLNTSTFVMNVLATVNTFSVNYRGRPFMEDLQDNKLLLRSLQVGYGVLFLCIFEVFPPLNDLLQLAELPQKAMSDGEAYIDWRQALTDGTLLLIVRSMGFPAFMCALMVCDTLLAFAAEKMIVRTFEA